jgi:hypothetical protein
LQACGINRSRGIAMIRNRYFQRIERCHHAGATRKREGDVSVPFAWHRVAGMLFAGSAYFAAEGLPVSFSLMRADLPERSRR